MPLRHLSAHPSTHRTQVNILMPSRVPAAGSISCHIVTCQQPCLASLHIVPLEEVHVAQVHGRLLGQCNLLIIEQHPAAVLLNVADVVTTGGVASHMADDSNQTVLALSITERCYTHARRWLRRVCSSGGSAVNLSDLAIKIIHVREKPISCSLYVAVRGLERRLCLFLSEAHGCEAAHRHSIEGIRGTIGGCYISRVRQGAIEVGVLHVPEHPLHGRLRAGVSCR
mmetsp:Transcript_34368/g.61329  ORF Transcript_34368/g.61329 Transcript_34368/m.61329 type:complete len:226 (-) Transcript_34368:2177-2854(-)